MPRSARRTRFVPLVVAPLLALTGCESVTEPGEGPDAPEALESRGRSADGTTVSKPFKASFFTDLAGFVEDEACGVLPRGLNTQVGEGQATHLGRFTVVITFCADVTDLLDDGRLTEGESIPYDQGTGVFTAANGDELYLADIAGTVLPSLDTDFDFEFQDPFVFGGGTGRFAGATGGGWTDSFVNATTNRTLHDWEGTLTLPK